MAILIYRSIDGNIFYMFHCSYDYERLVRVGRLKLNQSGVELCAYASYHWSQMAGSWGMRARIE